MKCTCVFRQSSTVELRCMRVSDSCSFCGKQINPIWFNGAALINIYSANFTKSARSFSIFSFDVNVLYFRSGRGRKKKEPGKLFLNTNSFILVQMEHTIVNVKESPSIMVIGSSQSYQLIQSSLHEWSELSVPRRNLKYVLTKKFKGNKSG